MDKVIIFSIYMRTLCNPDKHKDSKKNLLYIQEKLRGGERKYHKTNSIRYKELFKIAVDVWDDVKSRHPKKTMLNELLFLELHGLQKIKFTSYFKFKNTRLVTLYRQYCNENTASQESDTYEIISDLVEATTKALEIDSWKTWIEVNNRRYA